MNIQSLTLAYFSPTGTTKAVVDGISKGIGQKPVEIIDITRPEVREKPIKAGENELLIVAVPVYSGRVPAVAMDWLETIKAQKTPVVCVVVYGNRDYDDALLELKDAVIKCGGIPIAGAAFIGEHSFSSPELPTAEGRPDASDLKRAESFGQRINEKLSSVPSADQISDLNIPGNYPYGKSTVLWDVDFIAVSDDCTQCGICAEVCPVGAIDPENSASIDIVKCITCCACIKSCPQNARSIKASPVKDAAIRLNSLCKERKEPVSFL